jgi:hypothetical protein
LSSVPFTFVIIAWFEPGSPRPNDNSTFFVWCWLSFAVGYFILLLGNSKAAYGDRNWSAR